MKKHILRYLIVAMTLLASSAIFAEIVRSRYSSPPDLARIAQENGVPSALKAKSDAPAPVAGPQKAAPASDVRIYGVRITNSQTLPPAIGSFALSGDFDFQTFVGPSYDVNCIRGGFYADGFYYACSSSAINKYDSSDWSAGVISSVPIDKTTAFWPVEMTYDPSSSKAWGCFEGPDDFEQYFIGTLDIATGKATKLTGLGAGAKCIGLASDAHGALYALLNKEYTDKNSTRPSLYKVNTSNGKLELVTTYTFYPQPATYASMTFDYNTGRLYWASNTFPSALYEINPENGEMTKLFDMPNREEFNGIYIPYETTPATAPALLSDLAVKFNDAEGNATVTFTVPTKTHNGSSLSGQVGYTVRGSEIATVSGNLQPGAKASVSVKANPVGRIKLYVELTSNGAKSVNEILGHAGPDAPDAPQITSVETEGKKLTVKWDEPTEGANGGFVDKSSPLTYDVTLLPFGTVLATGITERKVETTLQFDQPTPVKAKITPHAGALEGIPAVSEKFIAGPAFGLPFKADFETADDFDLFTVEDIAGDGFTWQYSTGDYENYAQCTYSETSPKNDWIFTPAIHLEPGNSYTLTFKASSLLTNAFPETLEVKMGNSPASASMVRTLLEPEIVKNEYSWRWLDYMIPFTVETAGDYHIGFHAMTSEDSFYLAIDDIMVDGASLKAPGKVENVKAVPAAAGAHSATLTFTTPSLAVDGSDLASITAVNIYVNNLLFKTIDNPEPGKEQKVTLSTEEGNNTLSIVCLNESGRGYPVDTEVWTGKDAPAAPSLFRAYAKDDGVHIVWSTPEGLHGGMLDPEGLAYYLARFVNGGEQEVIDLLPGDTTEYTDVISPDTQSSVVYMIAARNNTGSGKTAVSNPVVTGGVPYELPFLESFAGGYCTYGLWDNLSIIGNSYWNMWYANDNPGVTPYDDDLGALAFSPVKAGDAARLYSGNIDISEAENPVLTLRFRGNGSSAQFMVQACADSEDWQTLCDVTLTKDNDTWTRLVMPLTAFKGSKRLQISLVGNALKDLSRIYVDNIAIRDTYSDDLETVLTSKHNFYPGVPSEISATVTNRGEKAAGAFKVEFLRDGEVLDTKEFSGLEIDKSTSCSTVVTVGLGDNESAVYTARSVYAADLNKNNDSASLEVNHNLPIYPVPESLALADPESHDMNWSAPAAWSAPATKKICDDFESYEPFIIEEIGKWKVVDENGAPAYGLIGFNFPHRNEARSWQVFNLWALGIEMSDDEVTWRPNSGRQMLVSFCEEDEKVDDWLISPPLSGKAQIISFYARSLYSFKYDDEDFEIYTSTTGDDIKDFTKVSTEAAPTDWTKFEVTLPRDTRYFAIKCVSRRKYAMALDDITYTPGSGIFETPTLLGYNVYQNNKRVNSDLVGDTSFKARGKKGDVYNVTAVYDQGESRFSNSVSPIKDSGVSAAETDRATVTADRAQREIVVTCAPGKVLSVVSADGLLIARTATTSDNTRVAVPASGVYIVTVGSASYKIHMP